MPDNSITPEFVTLENFTVKKADWGYRIDATYDGCQYCRLSNVDLSRISAYYSAAKKVSEAPNDFIFSQQAPYAIYRNGMYDIVKSIEGYFSVWVKTRIYDDCAKTDIFSRFWKEVGPFYR